MTTRKGLVAALQLRYGSATFGDRITILDEFVAPTGYHRKHAIRLLREQPCTAKRTRQRNRLYDEAVRQAPTALCEAADRVCDKRLQALIPKLVDAMERHGHLDLDPVIKAELFEVSAATIACWPILVIGMLFACVVGCKPTGDKIAGPGSTSASTPPASAAAASK
jgi:hypothetical protein